MFLEIPNVVLPADPCTISMQDSRVFVAAAVFCHGVATGAIASRKGSAIVTPMPRRTVRRERCFLFRNSTCPPY